MVIYTPLQRRMIDTYKQAVQEDTTLYPLVFEVKIVKSAAKDGHYFDKTKVKNFIGNNDDIKKDYKKVQGIGKKMIFLNFEQIQLLLDKLSANGEVDETKYNKNMLKKQLDEMEQKLLEEDPKFIEEILNVY